MSDIFSLTVITSMGIDKWIGLFQSEFAGLWVEPFFIGEHVEYFAYKHVMTAERNYVAYAAFN